MTVSSPASATTDLAPLYRMQGWVTYGTQTQTLGTMQAGSYLLRAHCHVTEAFNSNGTDRITVGWSGSTNSLVTNIDVSSTGVKTLTLGSSNGYNGTARTVQAYYTAGNSAPSTGKAFLVLEIIPVPPQP